MGGKTTIISNKPSLQEKTGISGEDTGSNYRNFSSFLRVASALIFIGLLLSYVRAWREALKSPKVIIEAQKAEEVAKDSLKVLIENEIKGQISGWVQDFKKGVICDPAKISAFRSSIVKNLNEAFDRIRSIIAPNHTYTKTTESSGRKFKIPCAKTGKCKDCRSSDRVCNIFTIIEGKPLRTDLKVVIVNEDLGLGWDPSWPETRIMQIINNHKKSLWIPKFDIL